MAILAPADAGKLAGTERDAEDVERQLESAAERLHERLFSCPAVEEASPALFFRKAQPIGNFLGTEHAPHDLLHAGDLVQPLEIDSEILLRAEGEQRETVRVREVEMEAGAVGPGQVRLAAGSVAEGNKTGRQVEVASDEKTQRRTRRHEPLSH